MVVGSVVKTLICAIPELSKGEGKLDKTGKSKSQVEDMSSARKDHFKTFTTLLLKN